MPKAVNILDNAAREAWRVLTKHKVRSLLTKPVSNPKLNKSLKLGILSAPLHLAPADISGFEVCPMRTDGCTKACLHTAGNPAAMRGKRRARNARTRAYFRDRPAFMVALAADIAKLSRQAKRKGLRCGVRLNATSDIPWERVPVTVGPSTYANLMVMFPDVTFYDYTKRHNRKALPSNYTLTFSLAEGNDAHAAQALANGMNVAAVFNVKRGKPLPELYKLNTFLAPHPVIDGDLHDFRPIDPRPVIVGLRAKGRAIGDKSGFVRNVLSTNIT